MTSTLHYINQQLAGGVLTGKYKYSDIDDKDGAGRFYSFGSNSDAYVTMATPLPPPLPLSLSLSSDIVQDIGESLYLMV